MLHLRDLKQGASSFVSILAFMSWNFVLSWVEHEIILPRDLCIHQRLRSAWASVKSLLDAQRNNEALATQNAKICWPVTRMKRVKECKIPYKKPSWPSLIIQPEKELALILLIFFALRVLSAFYIQMYFGLLLFMEANTMNPDQTAP